MISEYVKRRGGGGSPAGTLWALVYFNSFYIVETLTAEPTENYFLWANAKAHTWPCELPQT